MNLFQIEEAITNCVKLDGREDYVDVSTGEIIDIEALKALEMERDTKIRNIACWIKNLESDEKALADQEKIFRERKNAAKNKKEQLKSYLASFLAGKKWKNNEVNITWKKSYPVEITDINKLSSYYLKWKEPEPNKTLIGKDLKAGIKLNGAVIVEKNNMSVK